MSITQTYFLAHTARGKLSSEASRADHNLRLLVGHANLLDSLMLELAEAEQEQETWFNQSVRKASHKPSEPRHIQWADAVVEDPEEDWHVEDVDDSSDSSDSDSDYSSEDEMEEMGHSEHVEQHPALRQVPAPASPAYEEIEEFEDDGAEDYEELALTLTQSHGASPPELEHDSEDSSDDDSLPPSPPADVLPSFSEKQRQQIATTGFYPKSPSSSSMPAEQGEDGYEPDFFLPQRAAPGLISAISVY